jgi:hypothetical protein
MTIDIPEGTDTGDFSLAYFSHTFSHVLSHFFSHFFSQFSRTSLITDPSIAHDLCDACLYENPGDPDSLDKPMAAALRSRLEVFPNDHTGKKRAISF